MNKRLFDLVISLVALVITTPLFVIISILIIALMPGPIFFTQFRVGQNKRLFKLLKFRSMNITSDNSDGRFDIGDQSRITPLGRILRKSKLDEIPQLLNVIKGDMSIVGPRPEVKVWTEVYKEKWVIVHQVRPGITDNGSIVFRNEEEILTKSEDPIKTYRDLILPQKLDLYIDYVKNRSAVGDIKIMLRTIKALIIR